MVYIKTKEPLTALEIRTLDGRLVQHELTQTSNNQYELNLSKIATGMYLVSTVTNARRTISEIVKR
ncbi:MAG: T9SS type A sorting domain-containing protein [Kordia sp.]|uniref:T9SS type A sorting domain-containing protein n=1 Tax=Kordia sp. TaxID=1965332 RepID=UPI003858EBF2